MEMLGTSRSIRAAQGAAGLGVAEADVDALSRKTFLENIPLSQATNLIPFGLIALCCLYLPDWRMMALFMTLNISSIVGMYLVTQRLRREPGAQSEHRLWRAYEVLAFLSGVFWAALMLPVIGTLGRDIGSMFVCVVIIVSIAVTSMVVATQQRAFLCFLTGVMLCLIPQTVMNIEVIGPIPLAATIGLVPALVALARAIRKQNRLMILTQLEKQALADELAHALAAAEYLANRDSLTGLYNRRAFEEVARKTRADGAASPLSLILVDLDHFKAINDCHGHAIGDSVLQQAAQCISGMAGPMDVVGRGDGAVARWGGEEFILLLRNCPLDTAAALAERLRAALAAMRGADWPEGLVVTGSLGVAAWQGDCGLHLGISQADAAMYAAKQAGRNQVRVHDAAAVMATA